MQIETTSVGMEYQWSFHSLEGIYAEVFYDTSAFTQEDLTRAVDEIENNRDVVIMRIKKFHGDSCPQQKCCC